MKRSERIQRYLDGEMSEEEKRSFREDLNWDPELSEELNLHRIVEESIKNRDEQKFRAKLEDSYRLYNEKKELEARVQSSRRRLYISTSLVAAALIVLGVFIFTSSHQVTPESIYNEYYSLMEVNFSSRSARMESRNSNLESGIQAYVDHDFQLSKVRLEEYLQARSENELTARFFLGLSQLEMGNYPDAEYNFKKVSEGEFSYYQEHSRWYLALTYLKMQNISEAVPIFKDFTLQKSIYQSNSSAILKKISKIK